MLTDPSAANDVASQIARLYFDRQLTKVEIAERLGISRFRVARLLDQARHVGLVRIEYRDVPVRDRELAGMLETRFGLDACAVASRDPQKPNAADEPLAGIRLTARLAASLLDELVGPGDVVGIAWGSTLAALVADVGARSEQGRLVVPLAGGSTRLGQDRDPGGLAGRLAARWGADHLALYAPAFVETPALRDALMREPDVAAVADAHARMSLAIVGIGALSDADAASGSSLVRTGVLGGPDLERALALGAVGDLVVHAFDREGGFVAPDLAARAVAVSTDTLRGTPRVMAVAAGPAKAAAIVGALRTGVIDLLVTDAATASAVAAADDAAPRATAARRRPTRSRAAG